MPEITFVFGPNNSFFFDCPKTWKFHGIPQTLRQLFNSSMGPAWRIVQPYCVALAPAVNTPDPVWYVGCKTMSGEDKLFHTETFFEKNYPDLSRWLKSFPSAPQSSFITFGQNLSYFASARGRGSTYGSIPSELEDKIRKTVDSPSCVALGAKNAWFVQYPDGQLAWKFHGHYGGLNKILKTIDHRSVAYVALSPYHKEHYFISFHDKSIKYDFTGAPAEWMRLMTEVFNAWAAERHQKQAQPFYPPNPSPYPQQAYPQSPPFMPQQPYPGTPGYFQGQPFPSPQFPNMPPHLQGRPQSFYPNGPVQELPSNPVPVASTPNSPLPPYISPAVQPAAPVRAYGYTAPQGGAIEMPAELPGDALLSAPTPVPVRSASTEVSSSYELLARELFGADATKEKEEIPVEALLT